MATLNLSLFSKTLKPPISASILPLASPQFRSTVSHSWSRTHLKPPRPRRGLVLRVVINGNETIFQPQQGCDFNHWLVIMEFVEDPAPTRDEMIQTYLETLASVLGSIEDAKKNMYAFSTSMSLHGYTGFHCTVSEETSKMLKGLPGVCWVLPDMYLDVENKNYGGEKYIDGDIIP